MARRRKDNTLDVRWSKSEGALMYRHDRHPPDGHLLHYFFEYTKSAAGTTFAQELERRGFDLTTLRFSVLRKGNSDGS